MVPAAFVGLSLEEVITALFDQNIVLVGAMLLTGGFDCFSRSRQGQRKRHRRQIGTRHWSHAGRGNTPGISRSGATIATVVLLGIDKEKAARFSFLMVIPLIFGSMAKSILDAGSVQMEANIGLLIIGFVAAFCYE